MATIIAGIDRCLGEATDNRILSEFCQRLEQAGHKAINCGRGPSAAQNGAGAHSGDYMVQLAAGNCLCTLTDFYVGVKNGYYHVKKAGIVYWHHAKDPATWASHRAWDDNFCKGEPLTLANQYTGRPVKEFYDDHPDKLLYVPKIDPNCTSGTKMAEAYLAAMNGGSVSSDSTGENSSTGSGGGTALDYIKQVLSDDDKYGVYLWLDGKELSVCSSGINTRVIDGDELQIIKPVLLSQNNIVLDSVEITEYDPITPNYVKSGKTVIEDKRLIERYGRKVGKPTAPFSELKNGKQYKTIKFKKGKRSDLNISDKEWYTNQLMLLKRGHGHTISFKHKLGDEEQLLAYRKIWCAELDLPLFGIHDYYHITKFSLDKNDLEAETVSLTLEPCTPSVYVEPKATINTNTNQSGTGTPVNVTGNDCNPNDSYETGHWANHRSHPPKCTRAGLTIRGNSNRQYAKDTAQHNSSSRELVEYVKGQVLYEYYGDNPKGASRCPDNMWNGSRPMRGNCADFARLLKCILDVNGYTSCICHVSDAPGHYYNAIWENGDWTVCDLCNSNAYGHANHGDQKPVGTPDNPAG